MTLTLTLVFGFGVRGACLCCHVVEPFLTSPPRVGLPGLDLVPAKWLHLTMQGVGFTNDVPSADVDAIVDAARRRLAGVEPPQVRIGPARVASEGIALGVVPREGLAAVRNGLRAAIADVWAVASSPRAR